MTWLKSSYVLLFTISMLFVQMAMYLLMIGWTTLAVITLLYIASWPAFTIWYLIHRNEQQQWHQLISYVMALREGNPNYRLIDNQLSAPAQQLYHQLVQFNESQRHSYDDHNSLFIALWQQLPYPICLFNENATLLYANTAACNSLHRPLLSGSEAKQLGFSVTEAGLFHSDLQIGWQQHSIKFHLQNKPWLIYYAADLRHPLYQQQKASQQQLIRVLSHELRNSLTPMASMSETLLTHTQLPEAQTRRVLQRISQRSRRLLGFIESYLHIQQLPAAKQQRLNLQELINELPYSEYVQFHGEHHCYADPSQFAQLLVNILKNSIDACHSIEEKKPSVDLKFYFKGDMQFLTVTDNGPGFANTNNLFTPFYTTKEKGSGIGLMLCQEIMHLHHGTITACNTSSGHARIQLSWPYPKHLHH